MRILDSAQQPLEEWRSGVLTRMLVSARNGAGALCIFEQFCDPGAGAPTHTHTVEEVLTVVEGTAEIWVDNERTQVTSGQSVIVASRVPHGFRNVGTGGLHVRAILGASIFEATFADSQKTTTRWGPD